MSIKNMAYWRAKNGCASKGSYDGKSPDLKANRSPMRMDPMTAMTLASTLKDAKGKEDSKGLDIMSMSPTPQKSSPTKQMTKFSDIKVPKEPEYNMSGDLYKKPSIVASDERKKSVREQVGDYNTAIDDFREKKKHVRRYKKAKNMIKDALYVPKPGDFPNFEPIEPETYVQKAMYMDERGRITTPHSPKKKKR